MKKLLKCFVWVCVSLGLFLSSGCESDDDEGSGVPVEKVVCMGDSITRGFLSSTPYPSILESMIMKPVVNKGVNGANSADGLGRFAGTMDAEQPSHVIIMYGANDAIQGLNIEGSAGRIAQMMDIAIDKGITPIVGLVVNQTRGHAVFNGRGNALNGLIRTEASSRGVRVVDTYNGLSESDFNEDGLHPNNEGQAKLAELFRKAL